MIRIISLLLMLLILLTACNKEAIKLEGELKSSSEQFLIVKMKSLSGKKERILDTIDVNNGKFKFKTSIVKPPVKFTFSTADSCEFDFWIGEYGNKLVTINPKGDCKAKVTGSFFNDELNRVQDTYNKMYINPIESKLAFLDKLNKDIDNGITLNPGQEALKLELEQESKKAYRLRKKSILKTIRKAPQNPISMALFYDEFEALTSWQKEEAQKYMTKYFSDTGLNWQFKN